MGRILAIDVAAHCTDWKRVCPAAERVARDTAWLAPAHVELGVTLANDAEQRQLNRDYRGQDRSTNVLAFPAWEPGTPAPPEAPLLLGDIVLAFETIVREAIEQGKPLADHLRHLIVHGVLHLLGYDHRAQAEAVMMESLETSILAKLGV